MDERVMQFRVGVFFLFALLVTAILLVLLGKVPKYIGSYPVQVSFGNAGGITKDTPVRKSGILIGRVGNIELTDKDERVLVTLNIQRDKNIYQDETPFITRDLLGDTAVVIAPSKEKAGPHEPIDPDKVIEGKYSEDPTGLRGALQGPIDTVQNTGLALTKASEQLSSAAKRVEDILNPEAQRDVHDILRDAAKSLRVMQRMLGDEANQTKLADALNKLPNTLDSMNRTFAATDETLRKFTQRSGPDQQTPIERLIDTVEMTQRTLRKFSESSEPGKPPPAEQIAAAMENIGEITTLLRTVMSRIEKGEGTLGALLTDRQLYNRLNRAAGNIELLSRELQPIVEDAGVFMDKAARHPGVIVRDAVKPGIGIK
jgi:phospholipid/cholesterol/gamma-HCH transport system substrate-binding protein